MSRRCEICGKGPWVGLQVSHSHRRTKTRWLPNLHKVRALVNGKVKTIKVCTRCLKAGKVQKVV
jgi:large subunit ribosomal protein L28|uniref:Large ribosomal subunit protein bL28 n=1 Tax=Dictyoglomus thermophilum TaxID=14 RepID=A0A7C3RI72_DICTH